MAALFHRRYLGSRRNRLTALHAIGAAAIVAIATATTGVIADPGAPSPNTGAILEQIPKGQLFPVLGHDVYSDTGAAIGRIVDLLIDDSGKPRAAIIDFGGFLGVGTRKVAVDWQALHFWPNDKTAPITLDLNRDQIKDAPEYQPSRDATVVGLPQVEEGQ
jgi:hypothetical protein